MLNSKFTSRYLLLAACGVALGCAPARVAAPPTDTLPANALQPLGRYQLTSTGQLELISSAVHFGFSFEGTECQVFANLPTKQGHSYLQYELDGVYQKRLRVEGSSAAPLTIAAPAAGRHTVWIYKATEASTGPINIEKVTGAKLKALPAPTGPLIEFIGNSITCGAASDPSEVPCGTGEYHDQTNAYQAYGPRVARGLKVNYLLSSVSGIGAYRTWSQAGPTMPQVYEKFDFRVDNPKLWDFTKYKPAVVSIALGTNDLSDGDGKTPRLPFDSASFVNNYALFVRLVKSKYPQARIALLSSPMVNGKNRIKLQNCLTAIKTATDASYPAAKPVAVYFFQPMTPHGCGGHPDVQDHAAMAKELTPFFANLMK
ncbi:GDSL-type esterase/lipase family protein [Hymenobacter sp. H14-R3]|uniref:SGNH/GDSL hydrolase family protein n=1 Tax=Hymenobacter sp. H14-R3 TaxID=3046308 RepID=UPI0024B98D93|nr:SGNH/GDSL hydrolase family protein [Hymenobacter sp. H14-R3]MDJ0363671.1 GDSL-type esterase/lipase family protein [Hymenobacter sp. H14-R3]